MPWGSNPTRFSKAAFERPDDETPIAEQLDAFAEMVKAGKIRHLGLSNESAWGTMSFVRGRVRGGPRVQSIQNAYSLLNRTFETALAEVAIREDVGLLAYSPLAQGYLTGKYLDGRQAGRAHARRCSIAASATRRPGAEDAIRRYMSRWRAMHGLDPGADGAGLREFPRLRYRQHHRGDLDGAAQDRYRLDRGHRLVGRRSRPKIDAIHQLVGQSLPLTRDVILGLDPRISRESGQFTQEMVGSSPTMTAAKDQALPSLWKQAAPARHFVSPESQKTGTDSIMPRLFTALEIPAEVAAALTPHRGGLSTGRAGSIRPTTTSPCAFWAMSTGAPRNDVDVLLSATSSPIPSRSRWTRWAPSAGDKPRAVYARVQTTPQAD